MNLPNNYSAVLCQFFPLQKINSRKISISLVSKELFNKNISDLSDVKAKQWFKRV